MISEDELDALIDQWNQSEERDAFEFTGITKEVDGTYSWAVYQLIKTPGAKVIKKQTRAHEGAYET